MPDEAPPMSHPFSGLFENADPNALTFLIIGFAVGVIAGVAIMKVRRDRKKRKN